MPVTTTSTPGRAKRRQATRREGPAAADAPGSSLEVIRGVSIITSARGISRFADTVQSLRNSSAKLPMPQTNAPRTIGSWRASTDVTRTVAKATAVAFGVVAVALGLWHVRSIVILLLLARNPGR